MSKSINRRNTSAFTLIELLVVIGIIAILISVLLPVLSASRRSADKAKCLASLHQLGDAFKMYSIDNKGAWPVSAHFYEVPSGAVDVAGVGTTQRDKRWHDFIARYIMGSQTVTDKATGKKYSSNDMNFLGTVNFRTTNNGQYDTHGEFGTVADPIWIGTLRDRNSVLWGCPSWNKIGSGGTQYEYGANNGYAMNVFPMAPNDLTPAGVRIAAKTAQIVNSADGGTQFLGNYFKATQWTRQAERALVFDGIHGGGYWNDSGPFKVLASWPFEPDVPSQALPQFPHFSYPIDWNRHTKNRPGNVKASDSSMNMLFCDGHAATVSAREAYKAIRFH